MKITVKRVVIYFAGIVILSFGLMLNVKSFLGVAPILTMPFCISQILKWNFSNTVFLFYILFIGLEFLLKGKKAKFIDLIQFPMGLIITRMLDFFSKFITVTQDDSFLLRVFILICGVIVTGIGVALSVDMRLAPNPADGLAQAIGEKWNLGLGKGKNLLDLVSIGISAVIGMIFHKQLIGIGIGTVAAGILVGRVIAVFNKKYKLKLELLAGMEEV